MKFVLDTNLFIYATYQEQFRSGVHQYLYGPSSFTTSSLYDEIERHILRINMAVIKIEFCLDVGENVGDLAHEDPEVKRFKEKYDNIFDAITNPVLSEEERLELLWNMSDILFSIKAELPNLHCHPGANEDANIVLSNYQREYAALNESISNTDDLQHLILSHDYGSYVSDQNIEFVTEDRGDILNHEVLIQATLDNLSVRNFASSYFSP